MKLVIEIISNGNKLPIMIIENLNSKQVLPIIKQIINGVCEKVREGE